MDQSSNHLEEFFQKLKEYVEVRLNLFKLRAVHKISGFMSYVVSTMVFLVLFGAILLCVTIGVALLLGELLGKTYLGFFAVAVLYLIVTLILYVKRDTLLRKPIQDKLIQELSEEEIL
ncbi:MAG: phage holin family protein [Bacteroidota bacterium]|nr:phage holin family protein [Bacteroidota bacterium]